MNISFEGKIALVIPHMVLLGSSASCDSASPVARISPGFGRDSLGRRHPHAAHEHRAVFGDVRRIAC
jgi:hypothetical protein